MQLHTQPVDNPSPANAEPYRVAKACLAYVESSNLFTIRVVQAAVLITFYEISNAIYPAAHLSVGHCARLGQAMGIHDRKRAPQILHTPSMSPLSETMTMGLTLHKKPLLS